MGRQLTAQYQRAVSGMREVLIFGAMLWQVEAHVTVSTRGHGGKFGDKGTGLKGWLEQHAPEISRPTAYRFLGIAKAVAEEYEAVVGQKIAKNYDLPALVLADTAALSEPAKLKQGELFDYVAGTSQRSWLDRFKQEQEKGGKRTRSGAPETPAEKFKRHAQDQRDKFIETFESVKFRHDDKALRFVTDAEIELACDVCQEFLTAAREWLKTPRRERAAIAAQEAAQ